MSTNGSIGHGSTSLDMAAMREKMFQRTDTDGDGQLSKSELEEAMKKVAGAHGDTPSSIEGSLSIDEIFEKLDANGDGSLDMNEMDKMREIMPKTPGGPKGPPPHGLSGATAEQIEVNGLSFNIQDLLSSEEDSLQMIQDRYISAEEDLFSGNNVSGVWEI